MRPPKHVVYFKKDLRITDHAPLTWALKTGPVEAIYLIEPNLWKEPDSGPNHYAFLCDCLKELHSDLASIGIELKVFVSEAAAFFEPLLKAGRIAALYSHEETGNLWTYARDKALRELCRRYHLPWHESPSNGVIRPLKNRDAWQALRDQRMSPRPLPAPKGSPIQVSPLNLPSFQDLGLDSPALAVQRGGRKVGQELLDSFFRERSRGYRTEMSSPLLAPTACSRMSPHIAFGTFSIRELVHLAKVARMPSDSKRSFLSRLYWRCHFVQKLEQRPSLETETMHPYYEKLDRITDPNHPHFIAWKTGKTGYPFIDACMRYLIHHGWINFRMRAMLVSFASYDLWLDWRLFAHFLAQQFTDYEPGIHYSQLQMQAGTTGINTPRMYSPHKQAQDHDPKGTYIREWIPELAGVSDMYIHTPELMTPDIRKRYGATDYPEPIVERKAAVAHARQKHGAIRKEPGFREVALGIYTELGSRRKARRRAPRATKQS
jgi:deoxyribodipyrimidine photo-lyase